MARIELWNGDICDLEVDAIVSPASTSMWMSTGVAGELKRTGGDSIEYAALRLAPVDLGEAVVTPAGRLAARFVIHAVSLERDRRTSGLAIDRAARSAMARARELGIASVAFPALGTGIGGFPLEEAASIAVGAVRDELATPSSIEHVIFALRGAAAYEAFALALAAGDPAPTRSLLTPVRWQPAGTDDAAPDDAPPAAPSPDDPSPAAQSVVPTVVRSSPAVPASPAVRGDEPA